jgi:hypothetical protein
MNSIPRLLCLATLATAAFAQTQAPFVTSDPSLVPEGQAATAQPQTLAAPANQSDLQLRSNERTVLPAATVLRLKLTRAISTTNAYPGQQFTATLSQPVTVAGRTVIPSGATVNCQIKRARGSRRFGGKPLLSIQAQSLRLESGEQLSFTASVVDTSSPATLDVDQEGGVRGSTPNPMNKLEVGALAGVGAIAGAVIAGPEGLLIGPASGVIVAAGHIAIKHRELTLPVGTELIFELDAPATTSRPQMGGMQ